MVKYNVMLEAGITIVVAVILLWMLSGSEYGSGGGWNRGSEGLRWIASTRTIIGYILSGILTIAGLILNWKWTVIGGLIIAAPLTLFACIRLRGFDWKDGSHGSGRFDRFFGPFNSYNCHTWPLFWLGITVFPFALFIGSSFVGIFLLLRLIF
jgi:hypothetical protein